jgi:hypothetical protein
MGSLQTAPLLAFSRVMANAEQLAFFVANARQYWVTAIFNKNINCVF